MKILKYIFAVAVALIAMASCTIVPEDTFSTDPVKPVMVAHSKILITTNTAAAEEVTFVWEKARFIDAEKYEYDLYVNYSGTDVLLAEGIDGLKYSLNKADFRTFLMSNFTLEPKNSMHTITVFVTITDDNGQVFTADPATVKVYVYDDAVPAVLTAKVTEIVLDKDNPADEIELLRWEAARLAYAEEPTYKMALKVGEGAEVELAKDIFDNSFSITVDGLNEAVVAAGGVEEQETEVQLIVYAISETYPEGVPSLPVAVKVTTYVAVFPETLWVAGSHQGWAPATAPTLRLSSKTKGFYQGFLDLTTADGADAEFKFCPQPDWNCGEYGFDNVTVEQKGIGNVATSSTVGGNNTKAPSGFYYVRLDKKFGKLEMYEVKNLELIGSFAASNWSTTIAMNWDAAAKKWTSAEDVVLKKDDKIVIRFNSAWDYKFGNTLADVQFGGGDINFEGSEGTYEITLDASSADFTMRALNKASDYFLVGGPTGWSVSDKLIPFYPSGATSFTFTSKLASDKNYFKAWASADFGNWDLVYGYPSGDYNGVSGSLVQNSGSGALCFPTADEYYTVTVDFAALTFTQTKLDNQAPTEYISIGVVGSFNGWTQDSDDYQMTKAADAPHNWYLLDFEIADVSDGDTEEIKFNANKAWDISWGGGKDLDAERVGTLAAGANCWMTPGTYDIYFNDITLQYMFVKK